MTHIRISKHFWIKINNITKTKDECFKLCQNKFKSILVSEEGPNIHNIVIQNDFRVNLQYITDILKDVYDNLPIENMTGMEFSNIADVIKKLSCADPQVLYKGINNSHLG